MSRAKGLILGAGAALSLGFVGNVVAAEPVTSDEVRAIVAEMLADAETRSSLLNSGATAGHDGRFFIASPDGSFRLNVSGQVQLRYVINWRDEDGADDDFVNGFQARRNKLDLSGNIINKDWTYRLLPVWSRTGGATLEEAWLQYNFGNGWKARWGQFKLPLLREELVSSARQLAVERSVANEIFTQDRSQGIELSFEQEDWRVAFAFSDGLRGENRDFNMANADYAFTGRFEYKMRGTWSRFADFTSRQGDDFAALLGFAAHYERTPNTPNPGDIDVDTFRYTADISLEGDGWNAFGAFMGNYEDSSGLGGVGGNFHDFGAVVQGGYRFAPNTELFARWDAFFPDSDRAFSRDDYHFLTFGLNQYYAGHAAKASVDMVWALNETAGIPGIGTGTGILGSTEDNEITFRLQFQFLF